MKFVITYDVCEPGRLRRVARRLEQSAVRVQKSVFIFEGSRRDLDGIAADLMCLIDIAEDRVQAWPVHDGPGIRGWEAGTALPGAVAAVILSPEGLVYVEMPQRAGGGWFAGVTRGARWCRPWRRPSPT